MPEITVMHVASVTLAAVLGVAIGWVMRGNRTAQEKAALNRHWQDEIEAQRGEHGRLKGQNTSLMEQVSQFQASHKDATNRAKELSGALKEAFERRDELQREIKEVRSALQATVGERDQLQASAATGNDDSDTLMASLQEKDDKIFKLSRELENWQGRLPPLIERYQVRNEEAQQLETELEDAYARIEALEGLLGSEETRVEPVDPAVMSDGMDASNDPVDEDDGEELLAVEDILEVDDEIETVDEDETEDEDSINQFNSMAARDDLKQIKGVGPAIEKTLNELGIFTLDQIADMSEYDIDRVAKRLKGFRSRIYREDWIGQARSLQDPHASEQA